MSCSSAVAPLVTAISSRAEAHDELNDSSGPQAARSKRIERQSAVGTSVQQLFGSPRHDHGDAHLSPPPPPLPPQPPATMAAPAAARTQTLERLLCAPTASCHAQIAQLQDDKAHLTTYVERVLNQLRALLQRHGELEKLKTLTDPELLATDASDRSDAATATDRCAPWLTSHEFTNPLFQAYDLKIYELERSVGENKKAMDRVVARAEALAKENTALRHEIATEAEKQMLRVQLEPRDLPLASGSGSGSDDLFAVHENSEYLGEINERIDVLMSENNMLMEQVTLQDTELSAMRQELADRDVQLATMGQHFNDATLALTELRDACDAARADRARCEQQLQHAAARLAQLETNCDARTQQLDTTQTECRQRDEQLREYEALLAAVKANAARKDESNSARYQTVCARLRELNGIVADKERAVDALEEQVHALQTELDAARQDCEGMLAVLNGMEKQLTQYCQREDAVAELESDCKAKVEEVILEKEQLAAQETQSRREVARLLERLTQQTSEHLQAMDVAASDRTRKHDAELHARDDELRGLNTELTQVCVKLEFATHSQREVEKKLVDATRRSKELAEAFEKQLRQFSERAAAAEEAKDQLSHIEAANQQKLRTKDDELAKLRTESRDRVQELTDKLSAVERELALHRADAREHKDARDELCARIALLTEQLHKVKADCASKFALELDAVHAQNRELRAQAADATHKLAQTRTDAARTAETTQRDFERTEVRLLAEVESLRSRVAALKDERTRVETLRQAAESQAAVYALQLQQTARDAADTKEQLAEREHACDDAERRVSELSAQLALALTKQQTFYRQERELRTALERLTLDKTRMEREVQLCRKKLDESRGSSYAALSQSMRHHHHALYEPVDKTAAVAATTATSPTDVLYHVPT